VFLPDHARSISSYPPSILSSSHYDAAASNGFCASHTHSILPTPAEDALVASLQLRPDIEEEAEEEEEEEVEAAEEEEG
jgi:hypothetical protein